MLDKDNKDRKQEVRRAIEIVNGAFGAWEKCPAPKALNSERCLHNFFYHKGK